ncbi:hypothetical protein [Eggerthella lenta]|uniref:hypothetical protein n=1 Tax=Eggerthella lenta TaxID=84112 RepID=UPI0031B5DA72
MPGDTSPIISGMTNALPEDISCASCVWASRVDEDGLVECRRYPPEVYVLADGSALQLRPRMHPKDGCGEHGTYEPDG